jgi:hypothetical protein
MGSCSFSFVEFITAFRADKMGGLKLNKQT